MENLDMIINVEGGNVSCAFAEAEDNKSFYMGAMQAMVQGICGTAMAIETKTGRAYRKEAFLRDVLANVQRNLEGGFATVAAELTGENLEEATIDTSVMRECPEMAKQMVEHVIGFARRVERDTGGIITAKEIGQKLMETSAAD